MTTPDPAPNPAGQPSSGPPPAPGTRPAGPGFSSPATPPGLLAGIVLVVVGSLFLALRVADVSLGAHAWPLWIVVPGVAMLLGSLAIPGRGGLGLAVPGAILATVGLILWVQDTYGLYGTWAYAWALVAPTAPGLAMLLHGVVHGDRDLVPEGLRVMLTGIGLFLGFGLFFEGVIGVSGHRIANLDQVLPYAVIGLGVLLVVLSLLDGGRRSRRA